MALTVAQLRDGLRAGNSPTETAILTRLLGASVALVQVKAPAAPEAIRDEAAIRIAGYLFDQPNAGARSSYAFAMRSSGALSLLAPWMPHRAGVIGGTDATGTADGVNAVVGVSVSGGTLTVTFADGSETTESL